MMGVRVVRVACVLLERRGDFQLAFLTMAVRLMGLGGFFLVLGGLGNGIRILQDVSLCFVGKMNAPAVLGASLTCYGTNGSRAAECPGQGRVRDNDVAVEEVNRSATQLGRAWLKYTLPKARHRC